MQLLAEQGALERPGFKMRSMVLPDEFLDHDSPPAMYAKAGLDANGIVAKVFEVFGTRHVSRIAAGRYRRARRTGAATPGGEGSKANGGAVMKVILAKPRGFCAGVVRAIEIVERALDKYGPPVYVRHEIVHNKWVVDSLKARGARFVEDLSEVPPDAITIFSAHGVSKKVVDEAADRGLRVLNATCPLVSKVHAQGRHYIRNGRTVILIGHAGHPEVEGTLGQIPGPVLLVQTEKDVDALDLPIDTPIAYVTQTTLSVDDTRGVIAALFRRFKDVVGPGTQDICYATQNRQTALLELTKLVDVIFVVGAQESVQFQSAARNRPRSRNSDPPDRQWQRDQAGMAARCRSRRHHRRRLGAGNHGPRRHQCAAPDRRRSKYSPCRGRTSTSNSACRSNCSTCPAPSK